MTGYTWSVSTGGTINSGAGTSSISVTWTAAGAKTVSVTYTNANGCKPVSATVYNVTVNSRPVPTITGPATICANTTGNIYTTQAGMTGYIWTISAGGTIISGTGTNSISATWTTAGAQYVKVNYTSSMGCPALTPAQFNVTVKPNPVPTITGATSFCVYSTITYSTEAGNTGYNWTVSAGGSIVSGNGTRMITVYWNVPGAQTVKVTYVSPTGCLVLTPTIKNVTVNSLPVPTITGNNPVCVNAMTTYTTEPGMLNYSWSIGGTGGTIYSGFSSYQIIVKWSSPGAKYIQVNYSTQAGCRGVNATNKNITVSTCPDTFVLGSNDQKNNIEFQIYPNPNDGLFTAGIECMCLQNCSLEVYDLLGIKVYESGELIIEGKSSKTIDLRNLPVGIYSVVFKNNENQIVRRVIIYR